MKGVKCGDVRLIRAAERDELVKLRREALEAMNPKRIEVASNEATSDSGNSSGGVQPAAD